MLEFTKDCFLLSLGSDVMGLNMLSLSPAFIFLYCSNTATKWTIPASNSVIFWDKQERGGEWEKDTHGESQNMSRDVILFLREDKRTYCTLPESTYRTCHDVSVVTFWESSSFGISAFWLINAFTWLMHDTWLMINVLTNMIFTDIYSIHDFLQFYN